MFTGIVEELGEVVRIARATDTGTVLSVRCHRVADGVPHGGSIAVNGVCLTVVADIQDETDPNARRLDFDIMGVTLAHTGIGNLQPGSRVNLERAVRADGRLDGHIVQGHVDGTARVISRAPGEAWESLRFSLPVELARYVARKGSITVDGVSLTVSELGTDDSDDDWFEVGLIPETLRATTLGGARPGTVVNLEVDVLAKYTERLLSQRTVAGVAS